MSGDGVWRTGNYGKRMLVHSGSTSSYSTGPDRAFDGSYYVYCETSGSNYPAATFSLESKKMHEGIASVSFM